MAPIRVEMLRQFLVGQTEFVHDILAVYHQHVA
jgi:hypothetical protein